MSKFAMHVAAVMACGLGLAGSSLAQTKAAAGPRLEGSQKICTITFEEDPKLPARVEDSQEGCLKEAVKQLRLYPTAKLLLIASADIHKEATGQNGKSRMTEDETGEDLRFFDIAAYRAINTKAYLVQWMGVRATRVVPRTSNEASREVAIFLIPGDLDVSMAFSWTAHIFEDPCTIKPCSKKDEEHMDAQHRGRIGSGKSVDPAK